MEDRDCWAATPGSETLVEDDEGSTMILVCKQKVKNYKLSINRKEIKKILQQQG